MVEGVIQDIVKNEEGQYFISLYDPFFGVTCSIYESDVDVNLEMKNYLSLGKSIKIKGRCDGKLQDVRLTQCYVVQ